MDQRPRGVVDPVDVLRLGVRWGEGFTAFELVRQRKGAPVPEGDVAEDCGDGPMGIHREGELVVTQLRDQRAESRPLAIVLLDISSFLTHPRTLQAWSFALPRKEPAPEVLVGLDRRAPDHHAPPRPAEPEATFGRARTAAAGRC